MKTKLFIAFEGCDMSGKSTQAKTLQEYFAKNNVNAAVIKTPFNDKFTHKLIHSMLFSGAAVKHPLSFQLLQLLNKCICQFTILFRKEDVIIFDRWHLSSVVYGTASGLSEILMIYLGKILLNPDVVIVLTNDSETRFERGAEKDSYEKDARLQSTVAALYKKFCNNKTIIQVNATGTIEEVFDRVKLVLSDFNMMYLLNSKR